MDGQKRASLCILSAPTKPLTTTPPAPAPVEHSALSTFQPDQIGLFNSPVGEHDQNSIDTQELCLLGEQKEEKCQQQSPNISQGQGEDEHRGGMMGREPRPVVLGEERVKRA